jgi:predicted MFS family arabinose efflux permease
MPHPRHPAAAHAAPKDHRTMRVTDTTTRPFPWLGLVVLAALIFTSVTSEFLPTGLLPDIAGDLGVTESQVGLLITVFAGTVVLSSVPLSVLTRHHSRKALVIAVLLAFAVANVLAAVAPSYGVLVVARVLGGLAHGLFWAVVGAYAGHLVPPRQLGRAVAITSAGGTAAFVLGVPLGSAIGHAVGWRLAFVVIAAVILVFTVLAVRFLPPVDHRVSLATGEIHIPLGRDRTLPSVILTWAIVVAVALGHNTFYTYIAPFLIGPVGIPEGGVAGALFLYGGAGAVGLILSGVFGDRWPRAWLIGSVALVGSSVLIAGVAASNQFAALAALTVLGFAFGAVPALMQARMLRAASPRLRDLGSAGFTTSFNLSIAAGALLGGVVLDRAGVGALPFVEAVLIAGGIVLIAIGDVWLGRRVSRPAS